MTNESPQPVSLAFTHVEKEYLAATRLFYDRVYHTKFQMVVSSIVLLLSLIILLLTLEVTLGIVFAVCGLIVLTFNSYAYFVTPRQFFQRNTKFREQYSLQFSEDGLLFRTRDLESKLEWSFYKQVWETERFYFLIYDKDLFTLIPKRVFIDEAQESAFRDFVGRKITTSL